MATVIGTTVTSLLTGIGVKAGAAALIGAAVGRLTVGAALQLIRSALTSKPNASWSSVQDLKRQLSTPTERPPFRFVYGQTKATGSLLSWPVRNRILYGCWLLNSRPSAMTNFTLYLDEREVEYTGDPFDFDDFNGATPVNSPFEGHVRFWIQRGDEVSPPAKFLDAMPYSVDNPEYYKSTDAWRGRTVIWMRLDAGDNVSRQERWPSAPPLVEVEADWSKLYDPRNDTHDINDETTWEASDNQGLVLLDLLLNNPIQPYQTLNLNMDSILWTSDVADETVSLKSGGSEPRYRASGTVVFSDGVEIEDILEPVLIAGASKLTRISGRLGVIPATPKTSVDTVTNVIDGIKVDWLMPAKELPTRILGNYVNPNRGYENSDLPPYDIPGAQTADGGVLKVRSLPMTMVQSPTQAQRLVKITGYDARRQRTIETVLPPENMNLISGSEVVVDFPTEYATLNGNYEVISITPTIDVTDDGVSLRSTVEMLVVDDTGMQWEPATDEVAIYDEIFDLDDDGVAPPGAISVTIEELDTGGTVAPVIRFEFAPSTTSSVTLYEWEYRVTGGNWGTGGQINAEITDAEGDVFGITPVVSSTLSYDIRVRALSPNGSSDWREIEGVGVNFILTGVTASGGIASANFTGIAPSSTNFKGVMLYHADTGDDFTNATAFGSVIDVVSGTSFDIDVGDVGAVNEVSNGNFDSASGWTENGDWSIGSGVATHSSGASQDFLETSVSLDATEDYRFTYTRAGNTSGGTAARISGTTDVTSSTSSSAGDHIGIITAPASPIKFGIVADATMSGDIDNVYLVKDTEDALPLGQKDYWIVPVTNTGSEGSPVGPFTLKIF